MFDVEFEIKDALTHYDKPVSWTEIKKTIDESNYGEINPNTLHYHLKKLIQNGEVIKQSIGEELYYSLSDVD